MCWQYTAQVQEAGSTSHSIQSRPNFPDDDDDDDNFPVDDDDWDFVW